ncbi:MAG: efflux RND transporter periplasmic adaptor subunit, partial [Syntrophales bacterium]|nr:efflux RND transporter periplasmic adaptor subunit [Syntrophales bacterium]
MFGRTSSLTGDRRLDRQKVGAGSAIIMVLLCIAVFADVGCKKQEQKVQKERAVNVRVWTAENRPLRPFVESIGTLNPYEIVNVSSELDGILKTIQVDEGSPVTPSQVIAVIKETDY